MKQLESNFNLFKTLLANIKAKDLKISRENLKN